MYKIKDMAFDILCFFAYELKRKKQFVIGLALGYTICMLGTMKAMM